LAPLLSAVGNFLLVTGFACHYTFNLFDSFGYFCTETPGLDEDHNGLKENKPVTTTFKTVSYTPHLPSDRCVSTGVFVKARAKYRISVTRGPDQWSLFNEPSYMGGQPISRLPWYKELTMAGCILCGGRLTGRGVLSFSVSAARTTRSIS
jgi:hypothetical protein